MAILMKIETISLIVYLAIFKCRKEKHETQKCMFIHKDARTEVCIQNTNPYREAQVHEKM